jgi:hypothetical protein
MNNKTRILLISIILASIVSLAFLIVPITANFIIGYVFSILGIISVAGTALIPAGENAKFPQDYAFPHVAVTYLVINILLSVIVILLEIIRIFTLPFVIFLVVQIALLGFFIIRIILLFSGKEHIEKVGNAVKMKKMDIALMLADIDSFRSKAGDITSPVKEKLLKDLDSIYDLVKYSDPMSDDRVYEIEDGIRFLLNQLGIAINEQNEALLEQLPIQIIQQVRERNNRVKALK